MIKNSLLDYLAIRLGISLLRLIAPLSVLYTPCGFLNLFGLPALYNAPLTVYTAAEAVFCLFIYFPRRRRLQAPPAHPAPSLSLEQRQRIFEKCLEAPSSSKPYPTGWFLPANSTPTREEAVDWILWALFSTSREEGRLDLDDDDLRREMDGYINRIEQVLGHTLRARREDEVRGDEASTWNILGKQNPKVKSMRITLDPVQMLHRPLLWYLIVCLVDTYTTIFLLALGFRHYVPRASEYRLCFPPRPILSLLPGASRYAPPGVFVPYWFRPHRSTTKLPVVFLHGIGIGLFPYIPFIRKIFPDVDGDVGVLLPELLPISMHMTPSSVPQSTDMLRSLDLILESLQLHTNDETTRLVSGTGWNKVVLVAHSYGTFVAGWIVRMCVDADLLIHQGNPPDTNLGLADKIAHMVLVDPIPILLSDPTVAHNFLYREPSTVCPRKLGSVTLDLESSSSSAAASSHNGAPAPLPLHTPKQLQPDKPAWYSSASAWQLWYFASRDADVARTLCRAFFWAEGGIWRQEVAGFVRGSSSCVPGPQFQCGRNMAVVLGGMDQIVPSEVIRRYLTREERWEERWVGEFTTTPREDTEEAEVIRILNDYSSPPELSDGLDVRSRRRHTGVLEVLFNPKLDHAVIFDEERYTEPLVDVVRRYCAT